MHNSIFISFLFTFSSKTSKGLKIFAGDARTKLNSIKTDSIIMDFLKKNAVKFLEKAEESYNRSEYNFAVFFAEQSLQLLLKYLIGKKYGEFPKTHNLRILFELTESDDLMNLYRHNLDTVRELELSYVASRYMDVEYSKEAALKCIKLVRKVKEVIESAP